MAVRGKARLGEQQHAEEQRRLATGARTHAGPNEILRFDWTASVRFLAKSKLYLRVLSQHGCQISHSSFKSMAMRLHQGISLTHYNGCVLPLDGNWQLSLLLACSTSHGYSACLQVRTHLLSWSSRFDLQTGFRWHDCSA
jgi:hypothetical protein